MSPTWNCLCVCVLDAYFSIQYISKYIKNIIIQIINITPLTCIEYVTNSFVLRTVSKSRELMGQTLSLTGIAYCLLE